MTSPLQTETDKTKKETQLNLWIVVQVKLHKEQLALTNLQRQNFTCYCPMLEKHLQNKQHRVEVKRPLFPSYLFVEVPPEKQVLRPIRSTLGVKRIMGTADNPSYLPQHFISELKDREINGVIVKPAHPYHTGQAVQMFGGAFDGLIAQILDLDEKGRVTVLMELLNQTIKVKTDTYSIRPYS